LSSSFLIISGVLASSSPVIRLFFILLTAIAV
jgi:hypothetical protein